MSEIVKPSTADVESTMQKVSLVIAVVASTLMIAGLIGLAAAGNSLSLPGPSVIRLNVLVGLGGGPWGLIAMSAGIVLLGLLPAVRAFLAMTLYLRQHDLLDTVASLIVVLELLFSMHA